jgi:hypothetical protein
MSAGLVFTTLCSWVCGGCTVHFFWHCLRPPHQFPWERRWPANSPSTPKPSFRDYAYLVFVWIGVGYCIFRGAETTVQWMPRSWVQYSEDGDDPMWVGGLLAGMAAFFGSAWLLQEMEKFARKLADLEKDRNR